MTLTLGSPLSRVLALVFPAMAILAVWVMAVSPYLEGLATLDAESDLAARRLMAFERASAGVETGKAQADALNNDFAKRNWTYRGTTPDAATSALQQTVAELMRISGAQIRTVQALNPEASAVAQVFVIVQFAASMDSLANLLVALDNQRPLVFVEDLSIRPNQGQFVRPGATSGAQVVYRDEPVLDVMLKASVYLADGVQ